MFEFEMYKNGVSILEGVKQEGGQKPTPTPKPTK